MKRKLRGLARKLLTFLAAVIVGGLTGYGLARAGVPHAAPAAALLGVLVAGLIEGRRDAQDAVDDP